MLQQENHWLWLLAVGGIAAAGIIGRQIGNRRRRRRAEMRRAAADFDRAYRLGNESDRSLMESRVEYRLVFAEGQIETGFLRDLAIGSYDGAPAARIFPPAEGRSELSHDSGLGGV